MSTFSSNQKIRPLESSGAIVVPVQLTPFCRLHHYCYGRLDRLLRSGVYLDGACTLVHHTGMRLAAFPAGLAPLPDILHYPEYALHVFLLILP